MMLFTMFGFRQGYVIFAMTCFNVFTFIFILFDGNCDLKNPLPITILINNKSSDKECHWIKLLNPEEVPHNQSIFFIESNRWATRPNLTHRQACSVESAARINPDRLVFVLFVSRQLECIKYTKAMNSLLTYPNIRFRHIDFFTYIYGTIIEDFVLSGSMEKGKWKIEQNSDMLRSLTLWKFGGIYMDLDVVSLKPLPLINFVGVEHPEKYIATSVIGMQSHDLAEEAVCIFIKGWDGTIWSRNSPELYTNLMRKHCNTNFVRNMYSANCGNITVFPPEAICPIAWYESESFFDSSQMEFIEKKLKNAMTVHFWNKKTMETLVQPKEIVPYTHIASEYCPKVFKTIDDYF